MHIRRAKPEDKSYTLGDGQGLSLLIEPNGSKSWRFRYRYAGKPKMIRLAFTQRSLLPMLVPVVMKLENLWRRKEPSDVRKSKSWLCKQSQRTPSKR